MNKWNIVQCWVAPGCKSLSEAMNNPRLLRYTGFEDEDKADRYLERCKDKKEVDFHYWKEPIRV